MSSICQSSIPETTMSDAALATADRQRPVRGSDVVPTRLGDALIARITQAIHDGRLKPGDALPSESRIAASFGVSKPIAREAIRQLAAMGVVHIQQGKPTRVQALDAAPLDRFFRFAVRGSKTGLIEAVELRRILEPPIARPQRRAPQRSRSRPLRDSAAAGGRARRCAALDRGRSRFPRGRRRLSGQPPARFPDPGLRPVIREVMEIFNSREARTPADWRKTYERHVRVVEAVRASATLLRPRPP
jgi:GntR family transcriptional repressor for pyruvate dehydrogenase complex